MSKLSEFLSEGNKKSSQRLSLLSMTFGSLYLILIVGLYIIIRGFKDGITQAEWFGMAGFVFALLVSLGVLAGVKAYQKKFENFNPLSNE